MLLPLAIVHVFLVLVVISSMISVRDALANNGDSGKLKLVLLIQLGLCIDVAAYPLLCIRFNEHFRQAAASTLMNLTNYCSPCCRSKKSAATKEATEVEGSVLGSPTESAAQKVVFESRPRSSSIQAGGSGKKAIIDYRLAPEAHEHIVQRTWEMKPRNAK